jgi:hypothetical protein
MNSMDDKITVIWAVTGLMIAYMGMVYLLGDPQGIASGLHGRPRRHCKH